MKNTWDGAPVSREKPHGATVIVYRLKNGRIEFLVLHRSYSGPDYEGDWAWTPPSGARFLGEPVEDCARRELAEETGLDVPVRQTSFGKDDWWVYLAEAPGNTRVRLSEEHDRFLWLSVEEVVAYCRPAVVADPIRAAADFIASTLS